MLEGVDQLANLSEPVCNCRNHFRDSNWIVASHCVHCFDPESGHGLKLGQPHDRALFSNRPNELENVGNSDGVIGRSAKSVEIRFAFLETP